MKRLFNHLIMCYHYRMIMYYDKKFKKHCNKHTEIFMKQYPGMLQKQNGSNIKETIIDELHTERAYKKQESEQTEASNFCIEGYIEIVDPEEAELMMQQEDKQ